MERGCTSGRSLRARFQQSTSDETHRGIVVFGSCHHGVGFTVLVCVQYVIAYPCAPVETERQSWKHVVDFSLGMRWPVPGSKRVIQWWFTLVSVVLASCRLVARVRLRDWFVSCSLVLSWSLVRCVLLVIHSTGRKSKQLKQSAPREREEMTHVKNSMFC